LLCAAVALACACGEPAPSQVPVQPLPPPPPSSSIAPIASIPPPHPTAPDVPPVLPPSVARPASTHCTLKSTKWPEEPTNLTLGPGDPAFAQIITGAPVEVQIGSAPGVPGAYAFVTARPKNLVIEAGVEGALDVRPARPFMAAPFLAPTSFAVGSVAGGSTGTLRVTFRAPTEIVPTWGAAVTVDRPCDDFAFKRTDFDAATAFSPPKTKRRALFKTQSAVLLDGPGGTKLADLSVAGADAAVVDERGGHARILFDAGTMVAYGWVRSADRGGPSSLGGLGGMGMAGYGVGGVMISSRSARCTKDVPLIARVAGERRVVGRVLPGTTMYFFSSSSGGFTEVTVEDTGMHVAKGAALEVREVDLRSCGDPG
jgi:hypothetical protein